MNNLFIKLLKLIDYTLISFFQYKQKPILILIAKILSVLGSGIGLLFFSIIIFLYKTDLFIKFVITGIISFLTVKILKLIFKRIRPIEYLYSDNNILKIDRYSFPSGHSTVSFALCIILSYQFPHITIIFILLAILISLSRIYLLYHYLIDISAGAFLGIIIGFSSHFLIIPYLYDYLVPLVTTLKGFF